MRVSKLLVVATLVLCAGSYGAKADLATGYETQLASWLGEGPLTLTNVFTKVAGDGQASSDFHAAVDGIGHTFSLIRVTNSPSGPAEQIIGGYNPRSWDSRDNNNFPYNMAYQNSERTAFIFDLSTTEIRRQALGVPSDAGSVQTYNHPSFGPVFGGGHDIRVNGNLESGYAYDHSYGSVGASADNVFGEQHSQNLTYGALEVYTIAITPIPAPGAALLGMMGLPLVGWFKRRFA